MKTSVKVLLGLIAGLAVGFVAGLYVPTPTSGSGKGDISKVSKYSKNVVTPSQSAFQEKIMNDPSELKKTAASLTILNSRMSEFDKLVDIAVASSGNIQELNESVGKLQKVQKLAKNAKAASEQAVSSFDAMVGGDTKTNGYEQASQNLALAYLMVDRQLSVGKEYVSDVDSYMRGKKVEDNVALALSRDLWVGYCAGEAVLDGDSEAIAYWKDRKVIVEPSLLSAISDETISNSIGSFEGSFVEAAQECLASNYIVISNLATEAQGISSAVAEEQLAQLAELGSSITKYDLFHNMEMNLSNAAEVISHNLTLSNQDVAAVQAAEESSMLAAKDKLGNMESAGAVSSEIGVDFANIICNITEEMIGNISTVLSNVQGEVENVMNNQNNWESVSQ